MIANWIIIADFYDKFMCFVLNYVNAKIMLQFLCFGLANQLTNLKVNEPKLEKLKKKSYVYVVA